MIDYIKKIVTSQFEAALCMLNDCIQKSPQEHWDGKIANNAFWQVAYHTLCYVDLYLSPDEKSFTRRDFHNQNTEDPFDPPPARALTKEEITIYLTACRHKAIKTLANETLESLERESGFDWLPFTRGELHVYNIRHVMHHTGQLSTFLRRVGQAPNWVGAGWREP